MAKIATDVLKMGFTVVANPGNEVHASDEDIEKYGWADKLQDAPEAKSEGKSKSAKSAAGS